MACGCKGKKAHTADNPLILGEDVGEPAAHVRFTVSFLGMPAGTDTWVRGEKVAGMIDNGWFLPLQ